MTSSSSRNLSVRGGGDVIKPCRNCDDNRDGHSDVPDFWSTAPNWDYRARRSHGDGTGRESKRRRIDGGDYDEILEKKGVGDGDSADEFDDGSVSVITNDVPEEVNVCSYAFEGDEKSVDDNMDIDMKVKERHGDQYESNDDDSDHSDEETESEEDSVDDNDCYFQRGEQEFGRVAFVKKTLAKCSLRFSPPHELFLPGGIAPTFEDLKFESDDDYERSSDDDDDDEQQAPKVALAYSSGRTRAVAGRNTSVNGNRGLFQRWRENQRLRKAVADRTPPCSLQSLSSSSCSQVTDSSSLASDDQSSDLLSLRSEKSNRNAKRRPGVSFVERVTVRLIFKTSAYTPSVRKRMYTGRDELRTNKLRNRKEFEYEKHNWRVASEEGDMERDPRTGVSVHPAHAAELALSTGSSH